MYEFLVSDKKEARLLRKLYTFVLIPCLNPDGVLCGNYRNSIAGVDLNRQWIQPEEEFHPEIYHVKNLLKRYTEVEKRQIWIYCDIHGHSKKKNSFFYGCNTAANGGFLSWTIVRLLPRIFAQKSHMFNFKDCRFKVEPYKIGTGRVVAWKQFQITHSFTLENSFFGYDFGDDYKEFSEDCYLAIGSKFCESVYEFHYVWKQIQKELNITNGWLKPRVLLEITGIPAAQLLAEEQRRKKKEENKLIAIQQYQQFLAKFFNGKKSKKFQPKSLAAYKDFNLKEEKDIVNLNQIQEQDQEILNFAKSLFGLVKFQALVRGVLLRKRRGIKKQNLTHLLKLCKVYKKTDIIDFEGELYQDSEDNLVESRDSYSGSGIGRQRRSSRRFELVNRDWRNYFQQTELDKAFQIVEIEQRDISEEDSSCGGSDSDPSDDNLEKVEILKNVYGQNEEKVGKKLKEITSVKKQFLSQIRETSPLTAAMLYQRLKSEPIKEDQIVLEKSKSKLLKGSTQKITKDATINNSSYNFFSESPTKNNIRVNQGNFPSQIAASKRGIQSPYQNIQAQSGVVSLTQQIINNETNGSDTKLWLQQNLSQTQIENYYNNDYSQRQIWKNGKSLNSVILQNRIQDRAQTSYGLATGLGGPVANQLLSGYQAQNQPRISINTLGQMKLMQLHQKNFSKRDNINQVIKDCFITRKCGIKELQRKKITNKIVQDWPDQRIQHSIEPVYSKLTVGNATKEQPNFRLDSAVLNTKQSMGRHRRAKRMIMEQNYMVGNIVRNREQINVLREQLKSGPLRSTFQKGQI